MKQDESQKKPTAVSQPLKRPTFPPEVQKRLDEFHKKLPQAMVDKLNRNALANVETP